MMVFDFIVSLEKEKLLKSISKTGLFASTAISYYEIYMAYQRNKLLNLGKMDLIYKTSADMRVCEAVVRRAKRMMEQSIS